MFAYEYYKRNEAFITLGVHKNDNVTLTPVGKNKYTRKDEDITSHVYGYYDTVPSFGFHQEFKENSSEIVGMLMQLKNYGQAFGTAWDNLPGKDALEKLENLYNKSKINGVVDTTIETLVSAASESVKRNLPATLTRWEGQGLTAFKLKMIFLDKQGGPVYYEDSIKPLLAVSMYNGVESVDRSWSMKGPVGYNGTSTGFSTLTPFLDRNKRDDLHSLILKKGGQTVLDLKNILVIEGVDIATSGQLYVSTEREKGPAFKWITANISFKTAVPIPGPFSNTATNVGNFYGIVH